MAQIKVLKLSGGDLQQHDTTADDVTFNTITSGVSAGTAPFSVASSTLVTNLNADLLDGNEASAFATASHTHVASEITDFDTEVSNNTDVAANTSARHTQNTDTGTTATSFDVDSGGTGFKLKNNAGEVQLRNLADNAFADLRVKDLTVEGTTTTVNSETVTINDNIIVLNNNEAGTPSENAGIEVERGTSTNASITWDETADVWTAGLAGAEVEIVLTDSTVFDARYYTETEIGQTTGTTGSDLVGDDNSYNNFTPAATTVKGALSGIDSALGALTGGAPAVTLTAGTGGWSAGDAIYISANDTGLPADASAIATARVIGIAQGAVAQTSTGDVQLLGEITGVGSAWTAGSPVYLSETTGALTQTAPTTSGAVIIQLGIAINATDLLIDIKEPRILA